MKSCDRAIENWLHLDFKGVIPSKRKLLKWIEFFADCGFSGIIFELDCRYAWKTWEKAATPLFFEKDIAEILDKCREFGLKTAPLIQIHGHLEWILKNEPYARLKEADHVNELCPNHPDTGALIKLWIDEAASLFPDAEIIHLGADETWNLGTCPKCLMEISKDPAKGKMGVYIKHAAAMCRHAVAKGLRPVIWADMFWREKCCELASLLPKETILSDWQYTGKAPFKSTAELKKSGLDVWGASSARCAWYEHFHQAEQIPAQRLENVLSWNRWSAKNQSSVIHTTWGRPGNMWNLYPPWHGQLPVFIAAGNDEKWKNHHWRKFFDKLSGAMLRCWPHELEKIIADIKKLECRNEMERESLRWRELGLRYNLMEKERHLRITGDKCAAVTMKYTGRDEAMYNRYFVAAAEKEPDALKQWKIEVSKFWADNELSDLSEFLEERESVFN